MLDFDQISKIFENDAYAKACGIQIDVLEDGKAVCSFEIGPVHMNAGGMVHGGAIFTLADFTFAVAANSKGRMTVSLDNQIAYMHVAKGKRLIATAYEVSTTKSVAFYNVEIEDELGTKVAKMSVVGYVKG